LFNIISIGIYSSLREENVKRKIVISLTLLSILALIITMVGCGSSENTTTPTQTTAVTRGDISLEIMGSGNLALSTVKDLTFDQFYQEGIVSAINFAVGDTVTKGQVLASLDTSEWNDELQILEAAVTTAQRNVTSKERALATAERTVVTLTRTVTTKEEAVTTAERQVKSKELAVTQAQLDVTSANITLNKITEVKEIQDRIDNYIFVIKYAKLMAKGEYRYGIGANTSYNYWMTVIDQAQAELAQAQADLANILGGTSTLTSEEVALQVAQAQLQIEMKQMALEDAQIAVENAKKAVDEAEIAVDDAKQDLINAQLDVKDAQTDLDDANRTVVEAQNTLDNAKAASSEIVAPFDGFVTKVNATGGDQVYKGAVIVQVADPNKFEAEILVSEMDILSVSLNDTGTVVADAIADVSFPVEVTHISPTATISSSVVNYAVTVEVTSLTPVATTITSTIQRPSGNFTPPEGSEFPEGFTPPTDFTPSADFTPPEGMELPTGRSDTWRQDNTQTTDNATEKEYTLKSGMTVTVTLTIPLSTNVLLVPSSAIITQGSQSYVVVILDDGTMENRVVTTGNTDYTYTEITSGLTEGEVINALPTASTTTVTTTATTTDQDRPDDGFMIPGMGDGGSPPGGF
jgi:multidrug efflux pump subunit AcrA (membrane-fusion protein)